METGWVIGLNRLGVSLLNIGLVEYSSLNDLIERYDGMNFAFFFFFFLQAQQM